MFKQENVPSRFYRFLVLIFSESILLGISSLLSKQINGWAKQNILAVVIIAIFVFLLGYIGVYKFFSSKLGRNFYIWWRNFRIILLIGLFPKFKKFLTLVFPPEYRSTEDYQERIIQNVKTSTKIYFLLLNGHTMFYDREKFIIETMRNLPSKQLKNKDIRFQIMNKNQPSYRKRAEWFIKKMKEREDDFRVRNYEEYSGRCIEIERNVLTFFPNANIHHYDTFPIWRLFIFDNEIFVSVYQEEIEGHLSAIYLIQKAQDSPKTSLYWGFYDYFTTLYSEWTENGF